MDSQPHYLLIVGCSRRKRSDPGLLPAIERYDGVNFRVLRKAKREGYWPKNLDVLILSAKHGLLEPDTLIGNYDLQMTPCRARALQSDVGAHLDARLKQVQYREVFLNLGSAYLEALAGSRMLPLLGSKVSHATAGIGKKMSQMKDWLYSIASANFIGP